MTRFLFIVLFLFYNISTAPIPSIQFVSTDPQNQSLDLRKISSAGDSIIYIKGSSLFQNFLDFQIYIANEKCEIQGNQLNKIPYSMTFL